MAFAFRHGRAGHSLDAQLGSMGPGLGAKLDPHQYQYSLHDLGNVVDQACLPSQAPRDGATPANRGAAGTGSGDEAKSSTAVKGGAVEASGSASVQAQLLAEVKALRQEMESLRSQLKQQGQERAQAQGQAQQPGQAADPGAASAKAPGPGGPAQPLHPTPFQPPAAAPPGTAAGPVPATASATAGALPSLPSLGTAGPGEQPPPLPMPRPSAELQPPPLASGLRPPRASVAMPSFLSPQVLAQLRQMRQHPQPRAQSPASLQRPGPDEQGGGGNGGDEVAGANAAT